VQAMNDAAQGFSWLKVLANHCQAKGAIGMPSKRDGASCSGEPHYCFDIVFEGKQFQTIRHGWLKSR
jgi:hypothetical protein